jgi:hypothetical protein
LQGQCISARNEILGSFDEFSAIIGGILECCAITGFLSGREYLYRTANTEPDEWCILLRSGFERYGSNPVAARDLMPIAQQQDILHKHWAGYEPAAGIQRLGRAMASVRDRIFGSLVLTATTPDRQTNSNRFAIIPHIPPQSLADSE